MKNKKVQLILIAIGLLIFTVLFSIFSSYVRRSNYEEETTKKKKPQKITKIIEVTTINNSSTNIIEEFETPINSSIKNITPELRKTVKDFSEIENKVYEVVNAYYPNSKKIEYKEFKKDKEKYSYTFDVIGEADHEVIIYYWLADKSLSYQHY